MLKNSMRKILTLVFFAFSILIMPQELVLAQADPLDAEELLPGNVGTSLGLPDQDVRVTVARIIRVAMGLLGIIMVVLVLYGGFLWMTAGGNDENIGKAKKMIWSAVIGLAIVLSAYAISTFVINSLVAATSGGVETIDGTI